jgi:hypothetical protein
MFPEDKAIIGRKGYMTLNALISALHQRGFYSHVLSEILPTAPDMVLHFRFGTHGDVNPANCHPFPLSTDEEQLTTRKWRNTYGMAHNGILSGFSDMADSLSDTQCFIRDVLGHDLIKNNLANEAVITLLNKATTGSKILIMGLEGVYRLGTDWVEDKGVLYSNSGYKWKQCYVARQVGRYSTTHYNSYWTKENEEDWQKAWDKIGDKTVVDNTTKAVQVVKPKVSVLKTPYSDESKYHDLLIHPTCQRHDSCRKCNDLSITYRGTGLVYKCEIKGGQVFDYDDDM